LQKNGVRLRARAAAGFLVLFSIAAFAAPQLQAQDRTNYIPLLGTAGTAGNLGLGIVLVNPSQLDAAVTLTARAYDGNTIQAAGVTNPATVTVPSGSRITRLASEVFGPGMDGQQGWVEIATAGATGGYSLFDPFLRFVDSAAFATASFSQIVYPKITARSASATLLTLVNTASDVIEVNVSAYDNSGQFVAGRTVAVAGSGGFSLAVNQVLALPEDFAGYVVAASGSDPDSAPKSLIGLEAYANGSDIALIRAAPASAALMKGYLPHTVSGGSYVSSVTLVNPADEGQIVQLVAGALETNGVPMIPSAIVAERFLAPHSRLQESVDQMFGLGGDPATGYILVEVESDTQGVLAFEELAAADGVSVAAIEAQQADASELLLPQIVSGAGFYNGLALVNPSDYPLTVEMDGFDSNGAEIASTAFSLNPGDHASALVEEFLGVGVQLKGGYIRVGASAGIVGVEFFGGPTGFLANAPVIGSSGDPLLTPTPTSPSVCDANGKGDAPVVSAGSNQTITLTSSANLNGTASDPNGCPLKTQWLMTSGAGTVTFGDASAPSTTAHFLVAGVYLLTLTATNNAGLSSNSTVTITVGCGATVSGTVTVAATATGGLAITGVQFQLDGADFGPMQTVAPYSLSWNTAAVPNGCHALTAVAWDSGGNQGIASVSTVVSNP
jgi:hypothetical protein